jgi:mycofactocin system RPExFGAL protein
MNLEDRYRLADGVAIRPERFGGLVYNYHNRRLYFIHNAHLAALVAGLTGAEPLAESLEALRGRHDLPQAAMEPLLKSLDSLLAIGVVENAAKAAA